MKTIRLLLLLAVAFAIVVSSASAGNPAPPQMPICDPGDNCYGDPQPPPPPPPPPTPAPDPGPAPGDVVASFSDSVSVDNGGYETLSNTNYSSSVASKSGCRTVIYTRTGKSMLGSVLFRHNLRVYWCWDTGAITKTGTSCYASDVVGLTIQAGSCNTSGYYYTWNGNSKGGRYTIGTANYSNCILKYGCIGNWNVNAEVWVNGNGTWTGKGT